jgi:hypothetical protein
MFFFLSCNRDSNSSMTDSSSSFEYHQLDINKKDSLIIKYLKKEDALLYKVKFTGDDITRVKKLHRDGRIEKWQNATSTGNISGDYYMYDGNGRLLKYRYTNPDTAQKNSIFGYDFQDNENKIDGQFLVEDISYIDSVKLLFPRIYFFYYDLSIKEINADGTFSNEIVLSNYKEASYVYKQKKPNADLSIDIYAKGIFPDSTIHQHFTLLDN